MLLPTRRAVVATALLLGPAIAQAQPPLAWPTKQLTIIVPFPPGGSVDAMARLIQPGLQQTLGATLVVEHKPGAQGSIGAAHAARAQPDGGTWLFVFDTHAVNPALQNLPFDTEKDLEPVLLVGTAPHILATHPSRPFKSLADVIAAAKEKPGSVTYASIGTGSLGHLTMVLLAKRAGVTFTHVAYRGGGPAMNDALAGHVDLIIGSTALVNPQVQGGGLRALVQTGSARQPALAAVPTAIEVGFPGFESNAWWGVFAPQGTPAGLIERFRAAAVAQMKEERIAKQLTETQQINLAFGGPDVLRQFLAQQMKLWGDVVRENGIKAGN
jgi:tripartite-type tricarboxylate transporter receptor subunit TctC